MQRLGPLGVALLLGAAWASACGSKDEARRERDGDAGEAGAAVADGGSSSKGGSDGGGDGGSTAPGSEAGAGGMPGATNAAGAGGAEPPGSGGAPGTFVPAAPRIALGGPHSCALKLDGTVACWGRGDHGELGDDVFHVTAPTGLAAPVAVDGLTGVAALSLGLSHSCALLSDAGGVVCWGAGNNGQLGDGSFHTQDDGGVATPRAVVLPEAIQIATSGDHACALLADTTVQCWGFNLFGQLGNGDTTRSATPAAVPDLSGVAQLAVGKFQTCALMDDQTVQCWGSGGVNNQAGTAINLLQPTLIEGIDDAVAIAAGDGFTCAIVAGGAVKCWGEGDVGQLGDGQENDSNTTIVTVTGLSGIVQLSAGARHVCALDDRQALKCWGDGEYGQLGDGVYHNGSPWFVTEPVVADVFSDAIVEVACGETHTCIRTSQDEVQCIGQGSYGQLGDGSFHATLPFGLAMPFTVLGL